MDDKEYHTQVGNRIRYIRKSRRYSQEALARGIGVTRNSVAGWESGQPITVINLHRVACFLDYQVCDLIPSGVPSMKSYTIVGYESADVSV